MEFRDIFNDIKEKKVTWADAAKKTTMYDKPKCKSCGEDLVSYGGAGKVCTNPECDKCPDALKESIEEKKGKQKNPKAEDIDFDEYDDPLDDTGPKSEEEGYAEERDNPKMYKKGNKSIEESTTITTRPRTNPRDLVKIASSTLGWAIAEQLENILLKNKALEDQNGNALRHIIRFLNDRGEIELAEEIDAYFSNYNESTAKKISYAELERRLAKASAEGDTKKYKELNALMARRTNGLGDIEPHKKSIEEKIVYKVIMKDGSTFNINRQTEVNAGEKYALAVTND